MVLRLNHRLLALSIAAALLAGPALAQDYPSRPITIVVPNTPGGSSDLLARAVGNKLKDILGQPMVIDNKPGASEMIATEFLSRATPDGYTIAIFSNALAINETMTPTRRYDAQRDLIPLVKLAELPFALLVSSKLPVTDLKSFVAYAKENPGKLNYGHVGVGAPHYLTMEHFKKMAGIDITPVPYKSSPPVYTGLLGGEIEATVGAIGGAVQFIQTGQVKALASMSSRRPSSQPNLPTVSEFGYPEFNLIPWMGLFAPAGTPPAVVKKLEAAILQAGSSPDVQAQLRTAGLEFTVEGSDAFVALVKRDIGNWKAVIDQTGAAKQ